MSGNAAAHTENSRPGLWRRLASLVSRHDGSHKASKAQLPSVTDLVNEAHALLLHEVRYGCGGEFDERAQRIGKQVAEGRVAFQDGDGDKERFEELWVSMLRLGLLDALIALSARRSLPLPPGIVSFLHFCEEKFAEARARGKAWRDRHPDADLFVLGSIVWGEEYIKNFMNYSIRSMLSAGNLPGLARQGRILFSIVTDMAGEELIRADKRFAELSRLGDVEFLLVSDEVMATLRSGYVVKNFYVLYGMLDHCSIFLAQAARANLFMIPVDAVVADGTLANFAGSRKFGYECCGGGNIVADTETFLPALDARFGTEGPLSGTTDEIASIAVKNAHHYFRSQILAAENVDFGKHPRELFWPIESGVEIHSIFIHPLFLTASALQRYTRCHFANIDYGVIPRMFQSGETIRVFEDLQGAYVNNFTAANRLYETTGRSFAVDDFIKSHDTYSFWVQRRLFSRPQRLPCSLEGWTPCRNILKDVAEIQGRLCPESDGSTNEGAARK